MSSRRQLSGAEVEQALAAYSDLLEITRAPSVVAELFRILLSVPDHRLSFGDLIGMHAPALEGVLSRKRGYESSWTTLHAHARGLRKRIRRVAALHGSRLGAFLDLTWTEQVGMARSYALELAAADAPAAGLTFWHVGEGTADSVVGSAVEELGATLVANSKRPHGWVDALLLRDCSDETSGLTGTQLGAAWRRLGLPPAVAIGTLALRRCAAIPRCYLIPDAVSAAGIGSGLRFALPKIRSTDLRSSFGEHRQPQPGGANEGEFPSSSSTSTHGAEARMLSQLQSLGVMAALNLEHGPSSPDMSVLLPYEQQFLGTPVLVELKRRLVADDLPGLLGLATDWLAATGARTVFFLSLSPIPFSLRVVALEHGAVLIRSAEEFLKHLGQRKGLLGRSDRQWLTAEIGR